MLVLIFAAVLLFLAPIYAEMIKNSANQNAQNRASMGKRIIMKNVETLLNSPSALNASYQLAATGAENGSAPYKTNSCLKLCLSGAESAGGSGVTSCSDVSTTFSAVSVGGATNYVGNNWEYFCSSYVPGASTLKALWHPMTLYSAAELTYSGTTPTGGTIIAGHNNTTTAYPNQSNSYATQGTLYNYDGTLCVQQNQNACPLVVMTYFHPLCPGDTLLNATPSVSGLVNPPSTLFPIVCNQAVAIQVAYTISRNPSFTGKVIGALADYDSRRDPLNPTVERALTELPIVPIFPAQGGSILPTSSVLGQPALVQVSNAGYASGHYGACVYLTNGTLNCWKYPVSASYDTAWFPTKINLVGSEKVLSFGAGDSNQMCAVTGASKRVQCWDGSNAPYVIQYNPGSGLVDLIGVAKVATNMSAANGSCALLENSQVWCWTPGSSTATQISAVLFSGNPKDICGGYAHHCVLTSTNAVQCWGTNSNGQLGAGDLIDKPNPTTIANTAVFGTSVPIDIACQSLGSCALMGATGSKAGRVFCWGYNTTGQSGNSASAAITQPTTEVTTLTDAASFTSKSMGYVGCAARQSGTYRCWGHPYGSFANSSSADVYNGTGTYGLVGTPYSSSSYTLSIMNSGTGASTTAQSCSIYYLSTGHNLIFCTGGTDRGQPAAGSFRPPQAAGDTILEYPTGPWRY